MSGAVKRRRGSASGISSARSYSSRAGYTTLLVNFCAYGTMPRNDARCSARSLNSARSGRHFLEARRQVADRHADGLSPRLKRSPMAHGREPTIFAISVRPRRSCGAAAQPLGVADAFAQLLEQRQHGCVADAVSQHLEPEREVLFVDLVGEQRHL